MNGVKNILIILSSLWLSPFVSYGSTSTNNFSEQDVAHTYSNVRLIVTTDLGGSDPDDVQSMIHLLVCSDRIDIEGLISSEAWVDDPDKTEKLRQTVEDFIEVLPTLSIHSSGYPSAEYLRSIVAQGQEKPHMDGVGECKDSPGSEMIASAILKDDPRPIWVAAWGGMNTMAQALFKLKSTMSEETFKKVISKVRIYDVLGQDDAGAYIAKHYPELLYIRNKEVYGWAPNDQWTKENIQHILPLGSHYPNRIWATEGDSPSFLYVYSNGLNDPEHPDFGGWGGRFSKEKVKNIRGMDFIERSGKSEAVFDDYFMIGSAPEGNGAIKRWEKAIHNDFAARMIWSKEKNFDKANHHPVAVVNGNRGRGTIYIHAIPGEKISLSALESYDPDNDDIEYSWSVYEEPSTYKGQIGMEGSNAKTCTVTVPDNIGATGIHIILEVTDKGLPQ
ncbi:MAG: DUF1593 domain-containing protein, partial [Muribaculaceae bacterium]|nr:DUF1593 domain-containing protein [Muribaculaceae bacterium]